MAEAIVIAPVIEKSVDLLFQQTLQELKYFWNFKSNVESLRNKVRNLETKRDVVNRLIDEAKSNAQVIGPDVLEWLNDVESKMGEAKQILERMTHSQIGCFFNCKCPNLKIRYSLSKKATTISAEIAALQDKGDFSRVGYPAPRGLMPFTSPLVFPGFESRLSIEQKIIEFLKDDSITTVALCGMGGVGKTTLVEKIADRVREDKLFDEVVMAVVSRDQDPAHIQLQLAENLGLKFEVNTLHARAERLYTRLMDQEKSILLILDDIWNEIDMHEIGIPNKDGRSKGLKVILTSRFMRVCTMMSVEEIIEVEILSEEEAWELFK